MVIYKTQGFSLVELMISMLLASMVAVITYSMFDTTSDSLSEINSLASSTETARFAMERVRTDLQMSGSMATPDSTKDIWVQPKPAGVDARLMGVATYDNWQGNTGTDDNLGLALYDDANVKGANSSGSNLISADGFVVFGAFDYPTSFEVSGFTAAAATPKIQAHQRGLFKLYSADPFRTELTSPASTFSSPSMLDNFKPQWGTRILRVMDRQGYLQFLDLAPIAAAQYKTTTAPPELQIPLSTTPTFKTGAMEYGLDRDPDGDTGYDAALIDAYWYHVERDPLDPTNVRLIRDRICAWEAMLKAGSPADFVPKNFLPTTCGGTREAVVIADRVADFQVWFDCVTGSNTTVVDADWNDDWKRPDPTTLCFDTDPNRIRIAHVRISIYAEAERANLSHYSFEDFAGNSGEATLATTPNARLRTYDINPDLIGAAPVVTLQSSFELMNYSYRNPL